MAQEVYNLENVIQDSNATWTNEMLDYGAQVEKTGIVYLLRRKKLSTVQQPTRY
ncbi:hypothetical protein [Flagellimonas abyssi]|uniref:Uncharacterized protein n=1 Tax=Flagellimonas abyssi TaxID=2864871 RepID=A0ABS7EWR2_9FLAO|nr:hypothetical protein [Allomuricauda abyssi]MBW8202067.1 hypothetical protein [Allomuricauda abyssi]